MPTFTAFDPAHDPVDSLATSIFTSVPGATLVPGSVTEHSGVWLEFSLSDGEPSSIAFYDGSIGLLGLGHGLLLTSGDPTPPLTNTQGSYGGDTGPDTGDADLQATVDAAFTASDAGFVSDVSFLEFEVNITDPDIAGLRFNVVFGSEEYPHFIDNFVDVAGVYVNGQNYALFNGSVAQPLSVLSTNVEAGNFHSNSDGHIPIEYNAVSVNLQVTAPVHQGINTIKIAIGDTKDSILDSGVFVSAMQPVTYSGFGLSQQIPVTTTNPVTDTAGDQTYEGNALSNIIALLSGHDVVDAAAGIDKVIINYSVNSYNWTGTQLNLFGPVGTSSQLVNVERVESGPFLFALDTNPGGNTYGVAALFQAALNSSLYASVGLPSILATTDPIINQWVHYADTVGTAGGNLGDVAQAILDTYAPGVSDEVLIGLLYHNVFGATASADTINLIESYIGPVFDTMGDLFATAALLSQNTSELDAIGFTGSIVILTPDLV